MTSLQKTLLLLGLLLAIWLGTNYLLPLVFPFLLGGLIAMAAEPLVRLGQRKGRMPRTLAAGLGVTATLALFVTALTGLGVFAVRGLGRLAQLLPHLEQTLQSGLVQLQDRLLAVAGSLPDGLGTLMTKWVLGLSDSGSELMEQTGRKLPGMMTSALGRVSDGALGLCTALLAGFMLSARLPKLKAAAAARLPERWRRQYLPALNRMRHALGGWLRAQVKLAAVTYGIVAVGFLLLRIPYGPGWALAVALVDAVPLLGTGTVLIPWAAVCLLQGENLRAIGLLSIYGVAFLTRSMLEPRLVGRQLGLDPLLALLAFYVGFRLWGILGMLLAPMLTAAVKSLLPQ